MKKSSWLKPIFWVLGFYLTIAISLAVWILVSDAFGDYTTITNALLAGLFWPLLIYSIIK